MIGLGARRIWTLGVVLGLGALLWWGGVVWLGSAQLRQAQEGGAGHYWPAVYVEAQPEEATLEALIAELEGWSRVSAVHRREPAESMKVLKQRLGEEEVRRMGVEAAMLPVILEVEPAVMPGRSMELVAQVAALEVREEVVAVDLPEARALEAVAAWKVLGGGLWAGWLLGLLGGVLGLGGLLWRVREDERAEQAMLERFGASQVALSRPTLVRGLVVGAAAGVAAALATVVSLNALRGALEPLLLDATLGAGAAVPVMMLQVLGGGLAGALAGWVLRRPQRGDSKRPVREGALRPLLEWRS
ncbi:hypothetical protein DL240_09420 [Lujinxingia litoralis]|uniref:Cell division protein FtsX n=1 Tax=Lujinxingia litoralis TaxID=2211119 RepID=A0A328CAA3_9DELT|nr:hypothetical protein DL240_09420 [Lujinxingia litoralis]